MTESSAKIASNILKRKSELDKDLSYLINMEYMHISIEEKKEENNYYFSLYGRGTSQNTSKELQNKVKDLLILETKKELEELDEKLKALNC